MTTLKPLKRGDTFRRRFTLGNGWLFSDFTRVKFTLRVVGETAPTEETDDSTAFATYSSDDGEVYEDPSDATKGIVDVPYSDTTTWPPGKYNWDTQGTVVDVVTLVHTLDWGTISIHPDETRSI